MKKRQLFINAIMSVMQVVVISCILFVLYRFLLKTIGVKQLGIWSLVLAATSVTQIANLGLSGAVVKFVAKYVVWAEKEKVSALIQTAAISVSLFAGFVLFVGYYAVRWILGLVIPHGSLSYALAILPYAIVALWLMMLTSVFHAGLDGHERIDLRSLLLMGGAVVHLISCFILVPAYGLMGLAYARVIQNFTILLISWFLLKKYLPVLPIFPYQWDKGLFKEIVGYGMTFQVISVITMLYDPITKVLLSKFGGLSMLGYYDMASRMVQQLRALILSANQVLVPTIAGLKEKAPEKIQSVYLTSYQLLFYFALPLYSLLIVFTPIISELWVGHYENLFVLFGTLLAIGWFANTLAGPAYFAYLGIGQLRWNLMGQIAIALLNAGLGFLLGILYGGIGVVTAWVFSLVLGSSLIYLSYHIKYKIPLLELLPRSSRVLTLVCIVGISSFFLIYLKLFDSFNINELNALIPLSFFLIVLFLFCLHPMRKRLTRLVANALLNKEL